MKPLFRGVAFVIATMNFLQFVLKFESAENLLGLLGPPNSYLPCDGDKNSHKNFCKLQTAQDEYFRRQEAIVDRLSRQIARKQIQSVVLFVCILTT
jgi:hypothetical protein